MRFTLFFAVFLVSSSSIASPNNFAQAKKIAGLIARAHLFMSQQYTIPLSSSQKKLFLAWNKRFPPTAWEREWAAQVAFIEGYENPYITQWA
ncbi:MULTISPECIES: endonuclease [Legionella]|nr:MULTISPECIES: endonuclease [Legionella]HAU1025086.1 hypothetical protein [Legionella pneumophila]MBL7478499.1 endonuclease [Legionella bononiensis]MBL7525266.1 endonuclease [Legionella bononiensis]MBL7561456.1 endonuclease [Legionella bononiensis]MDX1838160.1 endonuclease [Legionella taurinensis]